MVAIPPKLLLYAMANIMHTEKYLMLPLLWLFCCITNITDEAIGNIIMVVAVLLSHMLRSPVAKINPRMIRLPLVPVILTIFKAILLCKFHFSMARPSMNPPIKRKIILSAYGAAVASIVAMFINGKKMIGSKATTGMGSPPLTHRLIIRVAIDNTFI